MIFVTGGAGFIGSNFILNWFKSSEEPILNIDKLTYAGNLQNLLSLSENPNYFFVEADIGNSEKIRSLLDQYKPRAVLNFAAESHVDNSISSPRKFFETNVMGTFSILDASRQYWTNLDSEFKTAFRFIHVSTDEVYGSLEEDAARFTEISRFRPNSPYSASKASSDHLVRSYFHTFGFPVITTNCSNNYGPYQFPEKLIPVVIQNALKGKKIPLYGDGLNIRDWLHVEDHCSALSEILKNGSLGEVYNIGGLNEIRNRDLVLAICELLDQLKPNTLGPSYKEQIVFVEDRLGHDRRYAIDSSKLQTQLGWHPKHQFRDGIKNTVAWYLDNQGWLDSVSSGAYRREK